MANVQKFRGIVPALIIVIALGFIIYYMFVPTIPKKGIDRVIGVKLGEAFSDYLPREGNIIVFIPGEQESYVEGLKEGLLAKDVTIAKVVSVPGLEAQSEHYDDRLLEFYDRQLSENPDICGLIFFSQFPLEVERLSIFLKENPPKIALLTGMSPEITVLIRQGYVQTVVAGTPEVHTVEAGERIPPEEIFQQRFMIVTPDNLEDVLRKYPQYAR